MTSLCAGQDDNRGKAAGAGSDVWDALSGDSGACAVATWHGEFCAHGNQRAQEGASRFTDWDRQNKSPDPRDENQILDAAEKDLVDGFRFYETQSRDSETTSSIPFSPTSTRCKSTPASIACILLSRLLTSVSLCRLLSRRGDVARIHAVLDCRRSPGWIRTRLT